MSVIPNYGFSNKTSINWLSVEAFLKKVSCERRTVWSGLDGVKVIPLLLSIHRHGTKVGLGEIQQNSASYSMQLLI